MPHYASQDHIGCSQMGLRVTSKARDARVGSYKPLNLSGVYGAHWVSGAVRAHIMGTSCTVMPLFDHLCGPLGGHIGDLLSHSRVFRFPKVGHIWVASMPASIQRRATGRSCSGSAHRFWGAQGPVGSCEGQVRVGPWVD